MSNILSSPAHIECYLPVLASLQYQWFVDPECVGASLRPIGSVKHPRSLVPRGDYHHFVGLLPINGVNLLGFGSSHLQFSKEGCTDIYLSACFAGWRRVNTARGEMTCSKDGFFLLPGGDRDVEGACSNAIFTLRPQAVEDAATAMAGGRQGADGYRRLLHTFNPRAWGAGLLARQIHGLFHYIDACAAVDPLLPVRLALDDMLHRQVAVLLDPSLLEEVPSDRQQLRTRLGKSAFDDLIDYIRANLDQPLRLSDLEARSHYSRRALQYAFQEKLRCSPKQWIRQQRLDAAMEQLQAADQPPSIRAVALACGYRNLGLFSQDFKQKFGLSPSEVHRRPLADSSPADGA
ncbi:MAG: hypothetical protein RLZZ609_2530 [Cyanobacteriota bacterium]